MRNDHYNDRPPFEAGSDTSREASDSIVGARAQMKRLVLEQIRLAGAVGMTDDEIEERLCMRHQTVSARRRELVLAEAIRKTDSRRKTRSGRKAAVYVLATSEGAAW